tara:strand:+ start:2747 stop:3922 length:1176 start_codon:yes stop_codon:yes gene_type:complete
MNRIGDLEKKYVLDVLASGFRSSLGSVYMTKFEKEFSKKFQSQFSVSHVNGTATLHSVLEAIGVSVMDEVIVPPLTMSATSLAVLHASATPVFVDIEPETFVIDAKKIEEKITDRTKAIITVALYGLSPDMDPIIKIAKKYNLTIIEDNAQAFLSYYKGKLVGTLGDAASFSFQSSKHLSAGEGGIITTNNEELALKIRKVTGLGYKNIGAKKARISKDEIQHHSFERHDFVGWNYRMSELNCAVALAQTERVEELVNQRKKIGKVFEEAVKGFDWFLPQKIGSEYESSYWAFACKLDTLHISWDSFRKEFLKNGGDKYYGAWQLTYLEPLFRDRMFLQRDKYINQIYKLGLCPIAEEIQPKLKQFKTNYASTSQSIKQADILNKTLRHFD